MDTAKGYLTITELTAMAPGVTGDNAAKAVLINGAETLIDGYIGNWRPAVQELRGLARAATANTIKISAEDQQRANGLNMLIGCVIEILGGTGAGQTKFIKSQAADGTITVTVDWTTNPDTTSYYRIYQAGKVPRYGTRDLFNDTVNGVNTYFRTIPQALKMAVAAQVEYMQNEGSAFFNGGASNMQSESMDGYSYNRGENGSNGKGLIAPRVRSILAGTGVINRTGGSIIVPNTII